MRSRSGLLVGLLLGGGAACAPSEVAGPPPSELQEAGADLGAGRNPRADAAHATRGATRCSHCHTPEERNHAAWRETAMRLGHDVQSQLSQHTTCQCCHLGEVKGFGQPLERVCAECHDDLHVTIPGMGAMDCLSCHDMTPGGGKLLEKAWDCNRCHAQSQGDKPAIVVHGSQACVNCHRPHEQPWTVPRKCTDCHQGHETFHGADARDADGGMPYPVAAHDAGTFSGDPAACATCHKPHEPGGAASGRCYECHAAKSPATFTAATTFTGGHERCTTCHVPHGEANVGPIPCATCHTGGATLPPRAAPAHGACVNCHEPHRVQSASVASCAGCHAAVHVAHPDPQGRSCLGCHDPHLGAAVRIDAAAPAQTARASGPSAVACSHCHTQAKTDLGFHDGTTPCRGCHVPHAFTAASAKGCVACHAGETAAATRAAVIAGGHGHADCKGCHQPHTPKGALPACGSCHAREAQTAPAGHAACLLCHEAHPTSRSPGKPCASCHARETAGPHAAVACASCHRAHGPDAPAGPPGPATKPACASCHAPATLGGMHVVQGHADCAKCHGAHEPPSSARATCLACHADRKDHEPTAPVCSGCHGFRNAKARSR